MLTNTNFQNESESKESKVTVQMVARKQSIRSDLIRWARLCVCTFAVLSGPQAVSSEPHATSCWSDQPKTVVPDPLSIPDTQFLLLSQTRLLQHTQMLVMWPSQKKSPD